ncbi:MAG: TonB-dependent receptor [Candidatus Sulfotelmatobacter sp.]|jgi:hypothetical protein
MQVSCRILVWFFTLFTLTVLVTTTLWAQGGTGELTGLVTDASSAVIANASVTLTNTATGEKRLATTRSAGTYRFPDLRVVGNYNLEIAAKGFRGYRIADIIISVGVITVHDAKLEIGTSKQGEIVEAGAQQVQTQQSSISGLVDRVEWQQMPLETRSQNEFIDLLAGAEPAAQAELVTDRGAAVDGARSGTGNFLVDGFDNNDQALGGNGSLYGPGGANTTISPDAIQEYRVIEHVPPAEYGRAGGFITDTVLRSGTNHWHGSLFEYNRIQAYSANNWFTDYADERDHLVRNQFGGTTGGPIVKDKTFFYFTAEFHRLRTSSPLSTVATTPEYLNFVDSRAFEQWAEGIAPYAPGTLTPGPCLEILKAPCPGMFPNATEGPIFKRLVATQPFLLCVPGAPNCTISPNASVGEGAYTGQVFGFNPSIYPVPVYGTVVIPGPSQTNQSRYAANIDHRIGAEDRMSGAYLYDNVDSDALYEGGIAYGPSEPMHGRAQNAGIAWSHTFSPTILNQARMSYVRHTANFPGDPSANVAGIPAIATAFDSLEWGFGNSAGIPQFFTENAFIYKDDLSVTHGKHNFKGGALYERIRNGSRSEADYDGKIIPNSIEDLVTDMKFDDNADLAIFGKPTFGSIFKAEDSINPTVTPAVRPNYYRGFRANEFAAYLQDDWRIQPRMTLNLGLRWEYFGPPHNFQPGIDSNLFTGSSVTPFPYTPAAGSVANPFVPLNNPTIAGYATGSMQIRNNEIWNKDTGDFGPRFGFSWDVFGNQKAVIRAGYGIDYDRMYNNLFEDIRFNPPYFCFCGFGFLINGVPAGGNESPGIYTVPFVSQGLFNNKTLFPSGLPLADPRAMSQNLVTAYYEQAFFGVQYQLTKDMVLETNYVGTFGHRLIGILNYNTYPGRLACSAPPYAVGTPCADAGYPDGFDAGRPNPNFSDFMLRTNCCDSNYSALQVTLRKRFTNGLQFNANYTYAKAMDELSDAFTPSQDVNGPYPEDSFNPHLDYGPADFDVKHRMVVSYNYQLPFYNGHRWIGGWSTSSIISFQTGPPFPLIDSGADANQDGEFGDRLTYTGAGGVKKALTSGNPATTGFFNTSDFAPVTCPANVNRGLWCEGNSVGQLNRNTLYGPKYFNWDLGIAKAFKINEQAVVQFQANFFNVFNHPNFMLPTGDTNNPNFGKSTAAFAPRVGQLALRFDF